MQLTVKTTTLPPIRVAPNVRKAIESVLDTGETLSAFMLEAVKEKAQLRSEQRSFLAKALARSRTAERTGEFVRGNAVFKRLERVLARTKSNAPTR